MKRVARLDLVRIEEDEEKIRDKREETTTDEADDDDDIDISWLDMFFRRHECEENHKDKNEGVEPKLKQGRKSMRDEGIEEHHKDEESEEENEKDSGSIEDEKPDKNEDNKVEVGAIEGNKTFEEEEIKHEVDKKNKGYVSEEEDDDEVSTPEDDGEGCCLSHYHWQDMLSTRLYNLSQSPSKK